MAGTVVDDGGNPVAGARVMISVPSASSNATAPPVVTGPLAAMVMAGSDGSFHASLPVGEYVACAAVTTPGFLDPCHWSNSAPAFSVSAGRPTTGVNIVMAKGAVVHVHIADPPALLAPVAGTMALDLQLHLVTAKGLHYIVPIQASNAQGRDYAVTIPYATTVKLSVLTANLAVSDPSGQPFQTMSLNVPAATNPKAISLTITGPK